MQSDEHSINDQTLNANFSRALMDPEMHIPDGIVGPNGKTAPKRFGVYRNNVVVSLIDAMKDAYPSVFAILGEQNFVPTARNYIAAFPPKSPMMQEFGCYFAEFLANFPPLEEMAFLVDLAKAERAWLVAYHASDDEILHPQDLGAVPADMVMNVTFKKHPSSWLQASQFPLFALYCRRDDDSADIDLTESQNILISRPGIEVVVRHVGAGDHRFFEDIVSGETLGVAIGSAMEIEQDFDAANAIGILLESGCCTSLQQSEMMGENPNNSAGE